MAFENEREYLLKLAEDNGGVITVDDVLDHASDETSPLHRHFEWDDSAAAREYRRWQARALIAKCRITMEYRDDTEVRAFVSLPSDRSTGGGYRLMVDVLDDDSRRRDLMMDMQNRITYWRRQSALLDSSTRHALQRFSESVSQAMDSTQAAA